MSSVGGIGGGAAGIGTLQDILALRQQIIGKSQLLQQVHAPQGPVASGVAGLPGSTEAGGTGSGGFTGALQSALQSVNASQQQADSLSAGYEKGQVTDVAKVMLARQEASVGFEATLQVRNKLLSAYQDIMKLGI